MKSFSGASRESIRVLIADSNQTQSQLLSAALRRHAALRVTCCQSAVSDCLQALKLVPADIVLLGDGPSEHEELISTLRELHSIHPEIGFILLLDSYDRDLVVNAMRAGARGLFCRATQPFRALCRCITVAHQGQFWANTEQMGYVVEALNHSTPSRVLNARGEGLLTPREDQVVRLVAEGIGNRDVAFQLGVKENTIKKSLLRIYDKLGVSNRVELVLYALTHSGTDRSTLSPHDSRTDLDVAVECLDARHVGLMDAAFDKHSGN
jgi:two-component system, NarL family, response regulator DegU